MKAKDVINKPVPTAEERVAKAKVEREIKRENIAEEKRYLLERNEFLERQLKAALEIRNFDATPHKITAKLSKGDSESAAVVVWSDWHNEELVAPEKVNGLNSFNLEIFHKRTTRLFQGTQKLWYIFNKDTSIKTLVIGLIGDFISGNLHGDQQESNQLGPTMAIENALTEIISGIKFLLDNTALEEIVVVCKSGNHGRFTVKQRHNTESEK